MKKRLLLATLASGLLLSSLTAEAGIFDVFKNKKKTAKSDETVMSGGEVLPEEGATLKIWESEGPEGEFIEFAAKKFTAKYGIPVQYESVKSTEALTRLGQDGPTGSGADMFVFPHDRLGEAMSAGLIMENLVSADRVKNEFMSAASIASEYNGKIMAWPLAIETYALFYNKDILDKAPTTFEELIKFGKGFVNRKDNQFGIFWEAGNAYFGNAFIGMNGGYVFGKNGTDASDIGLNNSGAVKGLEQMVKLKEISVEKSADISYAAMMGLFQEGKIATIINGPWAVKDLKNAGVNYGIAPLPTFDGKHPKSFSGVRLAAVSSYSKYPKAAQLFAKFITSDVMLLQRFEFTKQIPPVKFLVNSPEIANNKDVLAFLQQAEFAVPMPAISEMKYMWDPVGAALAEAWDGKATAKEALDTAVVTMKEAMAAAK